MCEEEEAHLALRGWLRSELIHERSKQCIVFIHERADTFWLPVFCIKQVFYL